MGAYTLDSNILIALHRTYPRDVFPGFWDNLEMMVDLADACICREVASEVVRGGDELVDWLKTQNGIVCEPGQADLENVLKISSKYPEWVQGERNAADPWVVSHAFVHQRIIVSDERRAGAGVIAKNQKIPNVATEFGIVTLNLLDWARSLGWMFR